MCIRDRSSGLVGLGYGDDTMTQQVSDELKAEVEALADLVPCNNPHWRELFYRWFLNMVAHWRGQLLAQLKVGLDGVIDNDVVIGVIPRGGAGAVAEYI